MKSIWTTGRVVDYEAFALGVKYGTAALAEIMNPQLADIIEKLKERGI